MAARLWRSPQEAIDAMERGFRGIEILMDQYRGRIGDPAVLDSIGMSLHRNLKTICEGALYLVDWEKADINGTEEFPQLKNLDKKGDCVDATPEAKYAARGICDIKKSFEEEPITQGMIKLLLEMVDVFLEWAWKELRGREGGIPDFFGRFKEIKEIMKKEMFIRPNDYIVPRRMEFKYVGDKDLDNMTDEEIDELYRPKKSNNRKSVASLFIYLILKENTDAQHHFHIPDIQRILEQEYEIKLGRAAVGRYLQSLGNEEKTNIWISDRDGYWYSEDKPDWME